MRPSVHTVVWAMVSILTGVSHAAAQSTDPPKAEVSFGYQWLHVGKREIFPLGFNLDVAKGLGSGGVGLVVEAGLVNDDKNEPGISGTLRLFNVGAGLRVSGRGNSRVTPFVQIVAGAIHTNADRIVLGVPVSDSDTAFMVQPGGGVSVSLSDAWGLVGQADYRRAFFKEKPDDEFRFVAGARVSFR